MFDSCSRGRGLGHGYLRRSSTAALIGDVGFPVGAAQDLLGNAAFVCSIGVWVHCEVG